MATELAACVSDRLESVGYVTQVCSAVAGAGERWFNGHRGHSGARVGGSRTRSAASRAAELAAVVASNSAP
jgi:hypothetical protein